MEIRRNGDIWLLGDKSKHSLIGSFECREWGQDTQNAIVFGQDKLLTCQINIAKQDIVNKD